MKYLSKFVQDFTNNSINPNTHLNLSGGKYIIPDDQADNFYKSYNKSLKENIKLHIIECHKESGPIVIDIDFRFDKTKFIRQYTIEDIKILVKSYNNIIKQYVDVSDEQLESFVFAKSKPVIDRTCIKDGIHIMYPYIHTKPSVQYVIREDIIKLYKNDQLLKHLELKNTLDDIFDKSVIYKNGWIMYGSSKVSQDPYKLIHLFDSDMNPLQLTKYNNNELPKLLSIRKTEKLVNIKPDQLDCINSMESKLQQPKQTQLQRKKTNSYKNRVDNDIINDIQSLVQILSTERADDELKWMHVGWCLHNIDYRLLECWIEFSRQSAKFKEGECEKLWDKCRDNGFSIGSIYYWAKIDNQEAYSQFLQTKVNTYIIDGLSSDAKFTQYDIAKIIEINYKYSFVCASLKYDAWYKFENHKWVQTEKGHELRKLISSNIADEFVKASQWLLSSENISGSDKDRLSVKNCMDIITSLKTKKYKDDIMCECKELFYDKNFLAKLDSNIYLIGFENGVYDLKNNMFRHGLPNDYVSYTTKINYIEYDKDDININHVYDLFRQIQPDNELFEYLLISLASYLDGQIATEKFIIWTGTGSNGKSLTVEFFEQIFGDYCTKLPVSLITKSRGSSSSASPEIAKTLGKRFCVLQEPEAQDKINVGLMKEITGGDKIEARGLYKDPVIFKPQFKLLLTCNELPNIPSNDGGTWRRLRVLPFKSEFVDNPTKPNQFLKDPYLCEKLEEYGEAFMSILIHYYKKYSTDGLKEPDEVMKYTKEYRKCSDLYSEFIDDNIEELKIPDPKLKTTMSQIYQIFKDWYRENHPDNKCPVKSEVKKIFTKKYGIPVKGIWHNIKINIMDDFSEIMDDF